MKYSAILLLVSTCCLAKPFTTSQINSMALGKYESPNPTDASDSMINVQVPESSLTFNSDKNLVPVHHYIIEADAANWVPAGYANPSYLQNTSNYNSASVPQISINLLTNGARLGPLRLRPKLGVTYEQLERGGDLSLNQNNVTVTEHLNFYSLRAGAELSTERDFYRIRPIASVALLPSWESASTSAFSDGISKTPFLYEGTAGISLRVLSSPSLGMQSLSIETGVEHDEAFNDKTLAATAAYLGVRSEL